MKVTDRVNLFGVEMAAPAAIVVAVAALMVVFLVVSALRQRSGIRKLTAVLMVLVYVALPAALFGYTTHCVVLGDCQIWALVLALAFVFYASVTMANYRHMGQLLQNALSGQWSLIGYRFQRAAGRAGRRRL